MKLLARNMLGQRVSTVGDLGGRTESLKQKNLVGNIFKNSIDIKIHDIVGDKKDLVTLTTLARTTFCKTFQTFSKLFKTFKTFQHFSKPF